jgi:hypothetical protein
MELSKYFKRKTHSILSTGAYNKILNRYRKIMRTYRIMSSPWRALPNFIIAGAQKSGTTSLYRYLLSHPQIIGIYPRRPDKQTTWGKEVHYFDDNFDKPEWWYRFHFPLRLELIRKDSITGEASPEYLYHPRGAKRIASTVPDAKIIICLRNPVDRAISNYWHQVRLKNETLSMRKAFEKEEERIGKDKISNNEEGFFYNENRKKFSYLDKGIYADQVARYYKLFDRSQVLIIKSCKLFRDTQLTFNRVVDFLGISSYQLENIDKHNSGSYRKVEHSLKKELKEYFKYHNQRLYDIIDVDSPWW